jgi:glutamyl-tRNA synthetase
VGDYREEGFLPAAMTNFLCLLGWSPGNDRELYFAMDELVEAFSLGGIQKKSAVFDLTKLTWMNGQYLSRTPPADLIPLVQTELAEKYGIDAGARADDVERAVLTVRTRARTTLNVAHQVAVRLDPAFIERDEKAEKMLQKDLDGFRLALEQAAEHLEMIPEDGWDADALDASLRTLAERLELGLGKVMQPIRIAITGGTVSEAVNELLVVVGKDQSLQRMRDALGWEPK